MNKEKRMIEDWSISYDGADFYQAPERQRICVVGIVAMHNGKANRRVTTSYVVSVDGKDVTTRSGSVYTLGKVSEGYRKWLKKNRPDWDEENPIKILSN